VKIIKAVPFLGNLQGNFAFHATNEGFLSASRHFAPVLILPPFWPVIIDIISYDFLRDWSCPVYLALFH